MKETFDSIGKSIPRLGSEEKITGKALYAADIKLENPLILKVRRSDYAHALIKKVHVEKARAMEGVVGIFLAEDIPGKNLLGIINKDQPVLAAGKVRSKADGIALVAATTEVLADAACRAIEVEYEPLPEIFDPEEAMQEGAVKIHEKGNILGSRKIVKGDVDKIFASSSHIVEREYTTSPIEHTYLEPDAGVGFIDDDGAMTIAVSTQNPHYDHKEIVSLLNVQDDDVRIIQAVTGGGFGSKLDVTVQGFIAIALYHLRRPVRCVYSREEAYLATAKRHPFVIKMKTAVDDQGKLLAMRVRAVCNTGAYASYGMAVTARAAVHATGPYDIENVDIEVISVYTNHPFCGAMRGFGAPQMALAHESQIDIHAEELGIDPFEMRRLNGFRVGSTTCTGQVLTESVGFADCLDAIEPYYRESQKTWLQGATQPFKKRGIGFGGMWYGIGNTGAQNPSTARVEMTAEGKVTLYTGCADIGQGSTTILAQIAAEILGIEPTDITMVVADTKYTTNAGATSASRQTYISGNAVYDAVSKLADVLLTEAVTRLRAPKRALRFEKGNVVVSTNPEMRVALTTLAKRAHNRGGSLTWQGFFDPETVPLDPNDGSGVPYGTYAFACQMAEVEVDVLTGEVDVVRIVAAHDVGRAIHPENVKGQICGGIAMGLGLALMEEFVRGKTESMKDYHIPTSSDMPEVVPLIVESPEPSGPFGAKGVGEPALIPTAPAIVNGISKALGERIYSLPVSLERVLEASVKGGHFQF